jgi:hypothetical protein
MASATADGEIVAEFARMRIGNPLLDEAHSLFDNLRYVGRRCSVGPLRYCDEPGDRPLECFL